MPPTRNVPKINKNSWPKMAAKGRKRKQKERESRGNRDRDTVAKAAKIHVYR